MNRGECNFRLIPALLGVVSLRHRSHSAKRHTKGSSLKRNVQGTKGASVWSATCCQSGFVHCQIPKALNWGFSSPLLPLVKVLCKQHNNRSSLYSQEQIELTLVYLITKCAAAKSSWRVQNLVYTFYFSLYFLAIVLIFSAVFTLCKETIGKTKFTNSSRLLTRFVDAFCFICVSCFVIKIFCRIFILYKEIIWKKGNDFSC